MTKTIVLPKSKKVVDTDVETCKVKSIKDVHPLGTLVLLELLTPAEVMGTSLTISDKSDPATTHQGYVLGIGTRVPGDQGLEIGQRVFVSGNAFPTPDYGNYKGVPGGRRRVVVEYNTIKGVCIE